MCCSFFARLPLNLPQIWHSFYSSDDIMTHTQDLDSESEEAAPAEALECQP